MQARTRAPLLGLVLLGLAALAPPASAADATCDPADCVLEGSTFATPEQTYPYAASPVGDGTFTCPTPGPFGMAWGDGRSGTAFSFATIDGQTCTAHAAAAHQYDRPGTFSWSMLGWPASSGGSGIVTVLDSKLSVTALAPTTSRHSSEPLLLASFQNQWVQEPFARFSAVIEWGDPSQPTTGIIASTRVPGRYLVSGTHRFHKRGTYRATVTVTDGNGGGAPQVRSVGVTIVVTQQKVKRTAPTTG